MKVLHVISAFQLGGAEEIALGLAEGLTARGHECYVAAVARARHADDIGARQIRDLDRADVQYTVLGGRNAVANVLSTPPRLVSLVRKWKPDIVHSHTDLPDLTVSLASRFERFRTVRTIHNSVLWPTHGFMGLITESAFKSELVVSVSADARMAYEALRRRYRLSTSRHQLLINNAVSLRRDAPLPDRSCLVNLFQAAPDKVHFCFAGRFNHQKGVDVLLKAMAGLPSTYLSRFDVHAFGAGNELEAYQDIVERENLPVQFHPPRAQVSQLFPAFDAVLMPSRYEGLSLVALESLAGGVPIIGTSAPGLRESVPSDWPLLAPIEDVEAYRDLLMRFLDGKFDREELGSRGRQWVSEKYELSQMVDRYEAAYLEFLNSTLNLVATTIYVRGVARISFPKTARSATRRRARDLYQPFSRTGRLIYRLWRNFPVRNSILYQQTTEMGPSPAGIDWRGWLDVAASKLGAKTLTPLFYFPPQSAMKKGVAVLLDTDENPVACAKVAFDDHSKRALSSEVGAFDYLEPLHFVHFKMPEKYLSGEWQNAYYLLISFEDGRLSVSQEWDGMHTRIWHEFIAKTGERRPIDKKLWCSLPPSWQHIRRQIDRSPQSDGHLHCAAHGDLAPWNILRQYDQMVLFDFEHFCPQAPYFTDPAHFVLSVNLRARHKNSEECARALMELSDTLEVTREDLGLALAHIAGSKDWPKDILYETARIILEP